MGVTLGVDVGGSTTKIVGFAQNGTCLGSLQVKADDQITSLYGAIGGFLRKYQIALPSITAIVLTGVGASLISDNIYDIPTYKVDEFKAIGLGGLMLSQLDQAIVVSVGTGTAYVRATQDEIKHIGGSGMGGGTLLGLASKLVGERDINVIAPLAEGGNLQMVDLSIGDISMGEIPSLPPDVTASNFGKIESAATKADLSRGLFNMVFQTIGLLAVFYCRNDSIKDIVLVGTLPELSQVKDIFYQLAQLYGINFIVPAQATFATAIGATIPYLK